MSNIRAVFFSILPFSFRVADFASTITEFFSNGFANEIPCEGSVAHSAVAEPRRRPNEREMTKFFVRQIAHFPVSDFLNCFLCGGIIESLWLWSTRFCSMIDQCRSSSVWNNWTKLRAPTSNSEGGNESWRKWGYEIYSAAKLFSFPGLKKPMNMDGESVKKSRRRLGTEGSVDVGTE